MKLSLLLFAILYIFSIQQLNSETLWNKGKFLNCDFKDVVYNNGKIVVFGNYRNILMTDTTFAKWEQVNSPYWSFERIVNNGNDIFCSLGKKLIRTNFNIDKWDSIDIGDTIYNMSVFDNYIYLSVGNGIIKYNPANNIVTNLTTNIAPNSNYGKIIVNDEFIVGQFGLNKIAIFDNTGKLIDTLDFKLKAICQQCKGISSFSVDNEVLTIASTNEYYQKNMKTDTIWKSVKSKPNEIFLDIYKSEIFLTTNDDNSRFPYLKLNTISNTTEEIGDLKSSNDFYYTQIIYNTKIVNDKIHFVYGNGKTLFVSLDGGVNWSLKSHFLSKSGGLHRKNVVGNSIYVAGMYGQIFHSNNNGITWLPQKNNPNYVINASTFPPLSKIIINENGYGFATSYNSLYNSYKILETKDKGLSFSPYKNNKFNLNTSNCGYQTIIKDNDYYFYCSDSDYGLTICKFSGDTIYNSFYIDSLVAKRIILGKDNEIYLLAYPQRTEKNLHIYKFNPNDTSITDVIRTKFTNESGYQYNFSHFNNKFILSEETYEKINSSDYKTVGNIYVFNDNKIDELVFTENENALGHFFEINGVLYNAPKAKGQVIYSENGVDWKHLDLFDTSSFPQGKQFCDEPEVVGNKVYFRYSKNGLSTWPLNNILVYDLEEIKTSVKEQTEQDRVYLYNYKPYPIPAVNTVKSLIYWNSAYNIEEAEIGIYDIFGAKLNNINYSIQKFQPFSGNLIVDCTNIPSGVYFARVALGGENLNIPIVVSK